MKNEELRKIRLQLSAVSNKDQELIEAKRSVQRLEQKVEDLTAMLSSKTDQERQLHQEKQQLRVSLDREAQVRICDVFNRGSREGVLICTNSCAILAEFLILFFDVKFLTEGGGPRFVLIHVPYEQDYFIHSSFQRLLHPGKEANLHGK